jgi:putative SOS response-associated peptidase YedK
MDPKPWRPRFNIAPSQDVPVVVGEDEPDRFLRVLRFFRWGLVPSWAKDEKIGYKMINARSETVHEKPSFRKALSLRRCLVPADSFYEWKKVGSEKKPMKIPTRIYLHGEKLFAFAGLWEEWRKPGGEILDSFTILTTEANSFMRPIHERMPVILKPQDYDTWLNPKEKDVTRVLPLLQPFEPEAMQAHAVSTAVNSPKNEEPELIGPVNSL